MLTLNNKLPTSLELAITSSPCTKPQVMQSFVQPSNKSKWTFYLGATSHTTNDVNQLQNVPIINEGCGLLPTPLCKFKLSHIFHSSHLSYNLLFVNKFFNDNNYIIFFDNNGFAIKDKRTNRVLLHGTRNQGLYPIQTSTKITFQIQSIYTLIYTQHLFFVASQIRTSDFIHVATYSFFDSCITIYQKFPFMYSLQFGKSHQLHFSKSILQISSP